jgi:hypothetical protein
MQAETQRMFIMTPILPALSQEEDDLDDDCMSEYEPDGYVDGFVGCVDFNEQDLWED